MHRDVYAIIMAGGAGRRFWPEGREARPKQFLKIVGNETMIQAALRRLSPIATGEQILIVANECHKHLLVQQLRGVPLRNLILEPTGRNTAACIGLAAIHIRKRLESGWIEDKPTSASDFRSGNCRDPVMIVTPADHHIEDGEAFVKVVQAAVEAAGETAQLVTIGIVPSRPETGYGYIRLGEELGRFRGTKMYRVVEFTEKPGQDRAEEFLRSGSYLWNSGIFIWRLSTILEMLKTYLPYLYHGLCEIERAIATEEETTITRKVYEGLQSISIDYGVMEKSDRVAVFKGEFGWSDIGSWAALEEVLAKDEDGNLVFGRHVGIDTQGCIIRSPKKLVATIGIEGMVIVETDDVLLVCKKEKSQDVKKITDLLKREGMDQYL